MLASRFRLPALILVLAAQLTLTTIATAKPDHPFILWTREDAANIRKRIENEDWAGKAYEKRIVNGPKDMTVIRNLFEYLVMGKKEAGEAEKKHLLRFVGAVPGEASPQARLGDRRRAMQWPNVLRYDVLYDLLTPEERKGVEDTFRAHAEWQINDKTMTHTHISFLPNMEYSRPMSNLLMALALGDKKLIKGVANSNGGFVQYMNECVRDNGLYQEEFGKYYSMVFELLLWCRGLDRLGMDELGYGFVGKNGATMKNYLLSLFWVGYPTLDIDTERPEYPRYTDGDAKGNTFGNGQHATIGGFRANGDRHAGGTRNFSTAHMNGGLKLNGVHWWEVGHEKWPDDPHFSYFLAQSRPVADDKYYPTLLFDIDPIDPKKVTPPPAPSAVFPQRGILILRADESPDYWTSPAPAVTMRLAAHYVHRVCDSFALTGFHAYNRTLYANTSCAGGYAGGDQLWSASIFGHAAVIVDDAIPHTIDDLFPLAGSNAGLYKQGKDEILPGKVDTRHHFGPLAKFAAGRTTQVYDDVDQTRALVLTREYLLDASSLDSPRPRRYLWQVHAIGHSCPDEPQHWAHSEWLYHRQPSVSHETSRVVGDRPWGITVWQETGGVKPSSNKVGPKWHERRPGVRMQMLGAPNTIACRGTGPSMRQISYEMPRDRLRQGLTEPGPASIVVLRNNVSNTRFIALHEPYMDVPPVTSFSKIAEDDSAVAVRIVSNKVNDRILLSMKPDTETTLSGQGESFSFKSYAFLRVAKESVTVEGDCAAFAVRVPAGSTPEVLVNGKKQKASVEDGLLTYGRAKVESSNDLPALPQPKAVIAARWDRETLGIRQDGKGAAKLHLRNCGTAAAKGKVSLNVLNDLVATPAEIDMNGMKPNTEKTVEVTFSFAKGVPRHEVRHFTPAGDGLDMQRAQLVVGHHVAAIRHRHGPIDRDLHIISPRYHAKFYPHLTGAITTLIDPAGHRFDMNGGPRPSLTVVRETTDKKTQKTTTSTVRLSLKPYLQMFPKAYSEKAKAEGWIEERDQWQHEGAPFKCRFEADWLAFQYYQNRKEDKFLQIEWWRPGSGGGEGMAKVFSKGAVQDVATGSAGRSRTLAPTFGKDTKTVDAIFLKAGNREWGFVELYPSGTTLAGRRRNTIQFPVEGWFAIAFCKPDEFEGLAKRWVAVRDILEVE